MSDYRTTDVSRDTQEIATQRIAAQILIWRPEVILSVSDTADPGAEAGLPKSQVASALQLAQSQTFRQVAGELYLDGWQPSKLVGCSSNGQGEFVEQAQRVLREPGLAIWDVLLAVPPNDRRDGQQTVMRTLWTRSQNRASHTELLGGTAPHPDTRLPPTTGTLGNYQLVMGRSHRERILQQLSGPGSGRQADQGWQNELRFFGQSIPPRELPDAMQRLTSELLERQQLARCLWVLQQARQFTGGGSADLLSWAGSRQLLLTSSHELQQWQSRLNGTSQAADSPSQLADRALTNPAVRTALYEDQRHSSPFAPGPVIQAGGQSSPATELAAVARHGSANHGSARWGTGC